MWLFFSFIIVLSNLIDINDTIATSDITLRTIDEIANIVIFLAISGAAVGLSKKSTIKARDMIVFILLSISFIIYLADFMSIGAVNSVSAGDIAGIIMVLQMIVNIFL
jgi:hypothetical protein